MAGDGWIWPNPIAFQARVEEALALLNDRGETPEVSPFRAASEMQRQAGEYQRLMERQLHLAAPEPMVFDPSLIDPGVLETWDLRVRHWPIELVNEGREAAAGGTTMIIKSEFDASLLTAGQREELKEFYRKQLRGEWGEAVMPSWFNGPTVAIYLDNKLKVVARDSNWFIGSANVYVGYGSAGDVDGQTRLGVIGCLMGMTGHSHDAELQGEFATALGKVLAGVYGSVAAALVKANGPVERIAFSERGSAAWMDGAWRAPNGDAVEVGDEWVVVDLRVGEVEVAVEKEAVPASAPQNGPTWVEWLNANGWGFATDRTPPHIIFTSPELARRQAYDQAVADGVRGLEIVQVGDEWWVREVQEVGRPAPNVERVRRTLGEWLRENDRGTHNLDGRLVIPWGVGREDAESDLQSLIEFGVDAEIFQNPNEGWYVAERETVDF